MSKVTWLHLSDFHFDGTKATNRYDYDKVTVPLIETVARRTASHGPPDFVFATGDIGNRGQSGDYQIAAEFLRGIVTAAQVDLDRLWLVPGNHDVDRSVGRALLRTLGDDKMASEWFFSAPEHRENHLSKFRHYTAFLNDLFPDRPVAEGDVVHEPAVYDFAGHGVGILPMNSAWFCQDDTDQGKLWLGTRLIRARAERLRAKGADTILTLFHHPFSYLHEHETAKAWIRAQSDIALRGHLHSADVEAVVSPTGSVIEIAAGASYQGSDWPNRAFWGELDTDAGEVTLHPIIFVDSPAAATWVTDNEVFPDQGATGYSRTFKLPNRPAQPRTHRPGFPHGDWTAVNKSNWLSAIVDWFTRSYANNPDGTIRELLAHVFDIFAHVADRPNIDNSITDLAVALRPYIPADLPTQHAHHATIIELLAFGVNRSLSHLFMLPRVELVGMTDVPDYSRLLLATRYLAAGDYSNAALTAGRVGRGCCVALYVMGQCDRKNELNYEAESKFLDLARLTERIARSGGEYPCTSSASLKCLCNIELLNASLYRARGVVARRIGDDRIAVEYFEAARSAAQSAVNSLATAPVVADAPDTVQSAYDESPLRVLADVYYSYGYFWYERGNFARAQELFAESINAIAASPTDIDWDSPYTRSAIVYLIDGDTDSAVAFALKARNICKNTTPTRNREAMLSLAITTLTLRVLESVTGNTLIDMRASVEAELEVALSLTPPLSLGPVACHRRDAELLREATSVRVPEIAYVIDRLTAVESELRARPVTS